MTTDVIRDLEIDRLETVQERDVLHEKMKIVEREYMRDIAQNAKEHGLTNQAARDNAFEEMLAKDQKYQVLRYDHDKLVKKIAYIDIDISFARREFRRWELEQMREVE